MVIVIRLSLSRGVLLRKQHLHIYNEPKKIKYTIVEAYERLDGKKNK